MSEAGLILSVVLWPFWSALGVQETLERVRTESQEFLLEKILSGISVISSQLFNDFIFARNVENSIKNAIKNEIFIKYFQVISGGVHQWRKNILQKSGNLHQKLKTFKPS